MRAECPRLDGLRRRIFGRGIVVWLAVLLMAGGAPAVAAAAEATAPKAHIVSLGLWGLQNLFRTEANQAAAVLRAYYGRGGQVVVKVNTPATAAVTSAALQAALRGVAAQMNREQDLLVVVLTSHGSPEGIGIRTRRHGELLTPSQLRGYLQETGAANKVVIVSA